MVSRDRATKRKGGRRERNGEKKVAFYIYGYVGAGVSRGSCGQGKCEHRAALKVQVQVMVQLQWQGQLGCQLIAQLPTK